MAGYAKKLRERAGGAGIWIIDVRPRADLKPVYYLIFATRHIDGMLAFGESASPGLQAWRKYQAKVATIGHSSFPRCRFRPGAMTERRRFESRSGTSSEGIEAACPPT